MSIILDLKDVNVSQIRVGSPVVNSEGLNIYSLKYGTKAKDLIIKFPRTRVPFGINDKINLLSLSLNKNYKENEVYNKLQEIDNFFYELTSKIPDSEYQPLVEFPMNKDKNGELVINEKHGPHFNLSVYKFGDIYKINVDGVAKNTFDVIDVQDYIHPGASISCAARFCSMVQKENGVFVIRPKLLKIKVAEQEDIDMTEEAKEEIEFTDLVL